jgi:hypothetical protein
MATTAERTAVVATPKAPLAEVSGPGTRIALSMPAAQLRQLIEERKEMDALIDQYLVDGKDYGKVPGIAKPTLFKPGAEKVCNAYNVYPTFELLEQQIEHDREVVWGKRYKAKEGKPERTDSGVSVGLYRYVVRCKLIHRPSGMVVGEGVGAASSMESKYVRAPREAENTILKMAKKRAQIDAALTAFNLSERFTQDVEDTRAAAADEEREEHEQPQELTLERALEWVFPWKKPAKYAGKQFRELSDRMLVAVRDWCVTELKANPDDAYIAAMHKATELVLASRAAASASQGTAATAEKPAAGSGEAKPNGEPKPGEPDPTSKYALTKRLNELLAHPAIDRTAADTVRRELVNGLTEEQLQNRIKAAEQLIAAHHPGDDDDFDPTSD